MSPSPRRVVVATLEPTAAASASSADGFVPASPRSRYASAEPGGAADGWTMLLDSMLNAVWLVDDELRVVAVNAAAAVLHGVAPGDLLGRPVLDFAVTAEDHAFWTGLGDTAGASLESEALVLRSDGVVLPVTRRVSRVARPGGAALHVVALIDRTEQRRREGALEQTAVELQATLESLDDGVLVVDLHGELRNFNRRFAELWQLPQRLLAGRDDAAVSEWMRRNVVDPAHYVQRLGVIADSTLLRASDVVTLRSGRVMKRLTMPQCSRGEPIGRVFTFREISPAVRDPQPAS